MLDDCGLHLYDCDINMNIQEIHDMAAFMTISAFPAEDPALFLFGLAFMLTSALDT